jgi:branched-chain amino acid transport system ATP-binding protein
LPAPVADPQVAAPQVDPHGDAHAEAPALELRDLRAGYGRIEVVHGVSLQVPRAAVYALLGPNGAGKTTTLKVAAGRHKATSGCVHVAGFHVNGASPESLAKAGVCSIPEGRGIFPNLSVADNLRMWTYGGVDTSRVEELTYARFPILGQRRTQLAGSLSGGEQQMLAMSRALTTEPAVLLLDEISMGLAPRIVAELYEIVAQLAAEGIAILLVEQFAHTALSVASRAAVMTHGRIQQEGSPDDVADALSDAYLGGAA